MRLVPQKTEIGVKRMTVETQSQSPEIIPAGIPPRVRFTSPSLLARNATLNLVTNGWTVLVLIVAMPRLVRSLGETSFGLFSLAWVMIGYLTFLDVGVNRAATKFISEHLAEEDHESARKILRTGIFANLAMGLAGGLAVALLSPYLIHSVFKISGDLEGQARWAFYAVSLAVPVLLVQGIFRAALSSFQRFGWINAVDALATAAQWTAASILAWKGYGVALVVFATVAARILATAALGLPLFRLFPDLQLLRVQQLHGLPKLLRFGSWVTISQLISPLLVYLDRALIASFISLAAVTLYTVPFEAMTRLRIIPSALVGTLYPAFSERGNQDQRQPLGRLYERSVRYLMLLLLPGTLYLWVLGPDLFAIWMGPAFARQTATVVQILALGVLVNALAVVPYNLLQALGRPDLTGKFHLLELPLYLGMCVLLIPRWGIAGAALASTLRFSLDSALLFWAARKYCGCSLGSFWVGAFPRIVLLGGILGVALFAIKLLFHDSWVRLGVGALAVGLSLLAGWILAVERDEKPRLTGVLRTLLGQPAI
jgi:O-antigen/teichoic acid export membrane protein